MFRKFSIAVFIVSLPILISTHFLADTISSKVRRHGKDHPALSHGRSPHNSGWFIEDDTSIWTPKEKEIIKIVIDNTLAALNSLGKDGTVWMEGFKFRHYPGEYAKNKRGKVALVDFSKKEILISDNVLLWENEFFFYHELGHILDHGCGYRLNKKFHELTMDVEGATSKHEWTTVKGYWMRGQAHIKHNEATADALALWVWINFAGQETPQFHDMPESAQPEAILEVITEAINFVLLPEG